MRLVCLLPLAVMIAAGQPISPLNCVATAVPGLVRMEGLAERVGDVVLNCTGGTPHGMVQGDLRVISYGGNITNRLNSATNAIDAVLTADVGFGPASTGATARLVGNNQFDFAGMNFQLGAAGTANLRITNVRIVPPQTAEQPFQFGFAINGPSAVRIENHPLTVGIATRGLLASYSSTFVCTVSPVPAELSFNRLLNGATRYSSLRFTEGFAESFLPRVPPAAHGTRLMVRFSGFPAGARLIVPEVLAGSSATIPTAAGDLGVQAHAGRYTSESGTGQLLLARVINTDPNGAGGVINFTPGPGTTDLSAVVDVQLSNGAGILVYEVLESSPSSRESVQLPVFLGLAERPAGGSVSASIAASFGPVSTDATASANPVPRYQALTPPPDCQTLGDCNSGIFPKLLVETEGLIYNPLIGQFPQSRFIRIRNDGGGLLNWAATIQYTNGSGWLSMDPPSGFGNATIRLDATAAGLTPGIYNASITIDAGPLAGRTTLPIRMEARDFGGPNPSLPPEISSIVHGATFAAAPLAPGTIATAFGNRLRGENVQLRVADVPARIFFSNDTQINFEIPSTLPSSGSVTAFVTVDTRNSPARTVALTTASPGIFSNAILNEDYTVNSPALPALAGSVLQAFLTGLPASGNPVTVKIHDYTVVPLFAGAAPGFIGLQQVNAAIPAALQSITTEFSVCSGSICSPGRPITVRRP